MDHGDSLFLLAQPISLLPLSDGFKSMAAVNGLETLDALLSLPFSSLLQLVGFTPNVRQELLVYLEEKQLLPLLKLA